MRKFIFAFMFIISAMLFLSCKCESDVLATFDGEKILRSDFYNWIEGRDLQKKIVLSEKSKQKFLLKEMAVEVAALNQLRDEGFCEEGEYEIIFKLLKNHIYGRYLINKLVEEGKFNIEVVKVRQIKLTPKKYKKINKRYVKLAMKEIADNVDEKIYLAKEIISKLKTGKSFRILARHYSDGSNRLNEGDVGYLSRSMGISELTKAAFMLKKGEFTKEPVVIGKNNSVYLLFAEDRINLSNENIDDEIENEITRNKLRKILIKQAIENLKNSLAEAEDVSNAIEKADLTDPNAFIFKIGKVEFKTSDLDKIVEVMYKNRGRILADDAVKRDWAHKIFKEALLYREACRRGFDKDKRLNTLMKGAQQTALANLYINNNILSKVTVDEEKVDQQYDRLAAAVQKTGNNDKSSSSLKGLSGHSPLQVKGKIRERLFVRKRNRMRQVWQNQLLKELNFKIDESELEVLEN